MLYHASCGFFSLYSSHGFSCSYFPTNWRVRFLDASCPFFGGAAPGAIPEDYDEPGETETHSYSEIGTLEYNLKFGVQVAEPDVDIFDREVWSLLETLQVSEDIRGRSPEEFSVGPSALKLRPVGLHGEKLSLTNRVLLVIARALLSSVDLLLLGNLLDLLPLELAQNTLTVLRELATNRCLRCLETEWEELPLNLRKPKLIIFNSSVKELESYVDHWIAFYPRVLPSSSPSMQASSRSIAIS